MASFIAQLLKHTITITPSSISLYAIQQNIFLFTNLNFFIPNGLYASYFLGPAWTLGFEFLFYFLAPFVVKSKKVVFLLLGIFFVFHFYAGEIIFFKLFYLFFLGSASYYLYGHFKKANVLSPRLEKSIYFGTILFLATIIFFFRFVLYWKIFFIDMQLIYFFAFTLIIPFAFHYVMKSRIDKLFGDLSYPLYVSHELGIFLFVRGLDKVHEVLAIVFVFCLSFLLYKFIDLPIAEYKSKRVKMGM